MLAREMSMTTVLLSTRAFDVWLPHRPEGCGSCVSRRNGHAGPALQKPLAGTGTPDWEQDTAQSRAQLRDHMPHLSLTQTLAPRLCHRNHGPWCPGAFQVSFLPARAVKVFLSHLLKRNSQWLPELPFLPGSSLHQLREAFIYRGSEGVLRTVL